MSWDDLRVVKAIGEHGGLAAVAAALGLNHSTISRRLSAVEESLGVVLFDRRRSGYAATAAGAEIIALTTTPSPRPVERHGGLQLGGAPRPRAQTSGASPVWEIFSRRVWGGCRRR
ncbi:LysR family transcriptional regulator [Methylobacterium isbiliense]|uniref:LysR family transcriptional regulator n=1 Tax=Methylobacterium isbiliense TaxID=315478 RepID=UPI0024B5FE58|nr:LysR family transcriptional regulator [Methylobacterium isbiliense]MDN3622635.1 LysR family transcriptional regulator [Methylobacterium isbiliense]